VAQKKTDWQNHINTRPKQDNGHGTREQQQDKTKPKTRFWIEIKMLASLTVEVL
jgi:hypothetical protein